MVEQLQLVNKMIHVVDKPNREVCVLLLQYNVEAPQNFYAQVQIFAKRKEEANLIRLLMRLMNTISYSLW